MRQFDASDEAAVKAVVEDALQKYGRLDVMFANAGIASMKVFYETTTEEFMKMMKTNVLRLVPFNTALEAELRVLIFLQCFPRSKICRESHAEDLAIKAISLWIYHRNSICCRTEV